jgi:hypothetical protein
MKAKGKKNDHETKPGNRNDKKIPGAAAAKMKRDAKVNKKAAAKLEAK